MTIAEIVNTYMFNYISTPHGKSLDDKFKICCLSMEDEMNQIKANWIKNRSYKYILSDCICQRQRHQYCMPKITIQEVINKFPDSQNCKLRNSLSGQASFIDFEDLYDYISGKISGIWGIGPLAIYDMARRIGHLLPKPIYPQQYVYLSAGAKEGAENLLGGGVDVKLREPIQVFQPYFGSLESIFIEDILCLYKDELPVGGIK
nr:hypothetical protein [uncultured Prevotella sp.]